MTTQAIEAAQLRAMVKEENARGGRLRILPNKRDPERDGPLLLSGYDSRNRHTRIVGDEEFICRMMRTWSTFGATS